MDKSWLCIHLPTWPIDRLLRRQQRSASQTDGRRQNQRETRRQPAAAALLFVERQGRQEVVMGCGCAASRGVRAGMTVAQATALLDVSVVVRPHEPEQDAAALQALGRWCLRFTPRVMAVPSAAGNGELILDMTGCDRLYRGPHRMVEAVVTPLRRLGLTVRAALAVTRAGASALARCDQSAVCLAGSLDELRQRLDLLPVEALGLEPSEVDGLNEVGIDRVEQLRAVPREEVVSRFGPGVLRRLDLAWGDRPCDDIEPVRRWEPPEVELRFAGPTTQFEAVQEAARQLCDRLAERLRHRLRAAATLTLGVERLDETLRAQFVRQTVTLSRPSREAKHLWAMLRPHVERLHLGHGVEALTLRTKQAPRVGLTQLGPKDETQNGAEAAAAAAELVDVLSSKLGSHRVTRPVPVATHVPEAAVRWVAAVESPCVATQVDPDDPAWCGEEWPEASTTFSVTSGGGSGGPTWLLEPIEPARVVLMNPEGPVLSVEWRGRSHRLISSIGPERIAPRWWKSPAKRVSTCTRRTRNHGESVDGGNGAGKPRPRHRKVDVLADAETQAVELDGEAEKKPLPPLWADLAARDYYRLQAESGLWLWVFRRLDTGRWFVHGVWV